MTPGDPAGIGPDLAIQFSCDAVLERPLVLIADREMLAQRAHLLKRKPPLREYNGHTADRAVSVLHVSCPADVVPGKPNTANSEYVLKTLDRAIAGCLDGTFAGLITGPTNKQTMMRAGINFQGHTEYLAARTGTPRPVMLLTDEKIRVALVTTHLPLRQVPASITRERIIEVATVLHRDLKRRFGIQNPKIAVCGLNPHAGEGGTLGDEEVHIVTPAIASLRSDKIDASGPYPADTILTRSQAAKFDAVLSMYHDQGLPAIKHAAFGNIVNVTLGLPIIRTSVDHGTAYDIAGSGMANPESLASAYAMALRLAA